MTLYLSALVAALFCAASVFANPVGYSNSNGYSNNNGGLSSGSNNGGFPSTGVTWGYGGCCYGFPDLSSYGSGASPFYGGNDAFNFASVLFANRNNGGNGYNNGGNSYGNSGGYGGNNNGNQNSFSSGSGIQLGLGWYDNLRGLINRGSAGGNRNGNGGSYGSSNNNY